MRGVWTALVTPFDDKGALDLESFKKILHAQRDAKITGVIPCGTTGETPTLSVDEKKRLIETALETLKGSGVKVVAGTGTNNTAESVELSRWASAQGVDGVLIVTPYYNKPSQAGMEAHYRAIADAISCELIVYNVPGRTGVSLTPQTIVTLASHPKITTLKEATGNVAFTSEIIDILAQKGAKLDILSGDDATYFPLLAVGAVGVISVASNLIPEVMVELQKLMDQGKVDAARKIHQKYYPIFRDLFVDSNPVPIKYALATQGLGKTYVRAPLVEMGGADIEKLKGALKRCEIFPRSSS